MNDDTEMSCVGCRYHLGAGMCSIHLEKECADGGGYEIYEPREENDSSD